MPESKERGALTEAVYYILLSVYNRRHGYAIMKNVKRLTGNRVTLGAGTLYGALNTLEKRGLIKEASFIPDMRKKEYIITDEGKNAIIGELKRLEELHENGRKVVLGIDAASTEAAAE